MSTKELGNMPAYPVSDLRSAGIRPSDVHPSTGAPSAAGLTKREAFAMAAMPSCYAEYFAGLTRYEYACTPGWRQGVAIDAFKMADAMLAESLKESS